LTSQKEIRYLCLRVFVAQAEEEYQVRLGELRTALRKPVNGAANLGIYLILKPKPNAETSSPEPAEKTVGLVRPSRKAKSATP
jgi:hypothetical protein